MTRPLILVVLAMLAFLGTADSFYLAESAVMDTTLVCTIDGLSDCNVVAQSHYEQLFNIHLGVYGVAFYVALFALILLIRFRPYRLIYQALLGWSGIGVVASLVFLGIQFFLIQALCVYCIGSAVITFITFPLSYVLYKRFAPHGSVQ